MTSHNCFVPVREEFGCDLREASGPAMGPRRVVTRRVPIARLTGVDSVVLPLPFEMITVR